MIVLSSHVAEQQLAHSLKQWVIVVSDLSALLESRHGHLVCAPYISTALLETLGDRAIVICDSESEAWHLYDLTHGDDGITVRGKEARERIGAPLEVKDRVYCCIINPAGKVVTENT